MTTAQICEQCGAPMKDRRKCGHCRTEYYIGPDVVDSPFPDMSSMSNYSSISTCMVFSTNNGYYEGGQFVNVEHVLDNPPQSQYGAFRR